MIEKCEYCGDVFATVGLSTHIHSKHNDEYAKWYQKRNGKLPKIRKKDNGNYIRIKRWKIN